MGERIVFFECQRAAVSGLCAEQVAEVVEDIAGRQLDAHIIGSSGRGGHSDSGQLRQPLACLRCQEAHFPAKLQ